MSDPFLALPRALLADDSLSLIARVVWAWFRDLEGYQGGPARASVARASRELGCSRKRILRAISELERAGWLTVQRANGAHNRYATLQSNQSQKVTGPKTEPVPKGHRTSDEMGPVPVPKGHRTSDEMGPVPVPKGNYIRDYETDSETGLETDSLETAVRRSYKLALDERCIPVGSLDPSLVARMAGHARATAERCGIEPIQAFDQALRSYLRVKRHERRGWPLRFLDQDWAEHAPRPSKAPREARSGPSDFQRQLQAQAQARAAWSRGERGVA